MAEDEGMIDITEMLGPSGSEEAANTSERSRSPEEAITEQFQVLPSIISILQCISKSDTDGAHRAVRRSIWLSSVLLL